MKIKKIISLVLLFFVVSEIFSSCSNKIAEISDEALLKAM